MAVEYITHEEELERTFPSGTGDLPQGTGDAATEVSAAPTPVKSESTPAPATTSQPVDPFPPELSTPLSAAALGRTGPAEIKVRDIAAPAPEDDPYAGLLSPIKKQAQETAQGLQVAANKFTGQVDPMRTWESAGAEGALRQAISTDSPTDLAAAKGFVGAAYSGPTAMDLDSVAALQNAAQELQTRSQSLQGLGGIENFLKGQTTGLTSGELAAEGNKIRSDPRFTEAATRASREAAALEGELSRTWKEAQEIAATRKAQEEDIATRSKGLLTGERDTVSAALDAMVKADQEKRAQLQDAYSKFMETGALADLKAIDPAARVDWSPKDFNTVARRRTEQGKQVAQEIMGRYGDIKDVPLLTLQITSHGRETTGFPQDWYDANKGKYTKKEMDRIRERATARQRELEAAGFSGTVPEGDQAGSVVVSDPTDAGTEGGKYSLYLPLYHGRDLQGGQVYTPPDIRNYTALDMGISPSRENVPAVEQRRIFNRIQAILEEADRIAEAGDTYRAATIAADVDKYLEDEEISLNSRRKELTANQQEWRGIVRSARKQYRRSRSGGLFNVMKNLGSFNIPATMESLRNTDFNELMFEFSFPSETIPVMVKGHLQKEDKAKRAIRKEYGSMES